MNNTERHGNWIQTYSGKQFFPLDPRAEDICIEDIAHALSLICRFAGHVEKFYCVAEHSVRVSRSVTYELALEGLLHDGSEAYMVDIPRPLKYSPGMENYRLYERDVQNVINAKFGLPLQESVAVKAADTRMLMTEQRDLMGKSPAAWRDSDVKPFNSIIKPWSSYVAERAFLDTFKILSQVN